MSGEKTLASGNVLRWSFERVGIACAFAAMFRGRPSEEDLAEAEALIESLKGPHAGQAMKARVDAFLGRGSSN